jgi:hypothetical protein
MKALQRTLEAWAKEYRAEHIPADVNRLINLATYDLYYGPVGDGAVGDPATDEHGQENEWAGYPGFVSATDKIKSALDDVPSRLFVDTGAECWSEREPGPDECSECNGTGTTDHVTDDDTCSFCDGSGKVEPFLEETYQVERHDLIGALVGKELAAYV